MGVGLRIEELVRRADLEGGVPIGQNDEDVAAVRLPCLALVRLLRPVDGAGLVAGVAFQGLGAFREGDTPVDLGAHLHDVDVAGIAVEDAAGRQFLDQSHEDGHALRLQLEGVLAFSGDSEEAVFRAYGHIAHGLGGAVGASPGGLFFDRGVFAVRKPDLVGRPLGPVVEAHVVELGIVLGSLRGSSAGTRSFQYPRQPPRMRSGRRITVSFFMVT